ncbi:MAG: AraC family transcriptional regulator [Oenococcus oeni]
MKTALDAILNHLIRVLRVPIRLFQQDRLIQYWGHPPHSDKLIDNRELINQLLLDSSKDFPYLKYLSAQKVIAVISGKNIKYLIGPVTINDLSEKTPILAQTDDSTYSTEFLFEELNLLQNAIHGSNLQNSDIFINNHLSENKIRNNDAQIARYSSDNQENEFVHNPYDQEVRELRSVTEGNLSALNESIHESYEGNFATLGPTKLRSLKNLAIVDLALLARAAIKGGIDYEQSFTINDQYIRSVEQANNVQDVIALSLQAKIQYTELVHDINYPVEKTKTNLIIKRCKKYIQTHLHNKIHLEKLAKYCNVSEQYLSKIFHNTQQTTVNEYIQREKIEASKRDLIYTDSPINTIALNFAYASTSHYGSVFKRIIGMTPLKYRNTFGKV